MKLFVTILQFADGLITNKIEAEDPRAAIAEAIRRVVLTDAAKWPLAQTIAVPIDALPSAEPPQQRISIVSVRGMLDTLIKYRTALEIAADSDARSIVRLELIEWFSPCLSG